LISQLLDTLAPALYVGTVYALLAVGYSVAYSTMNLVNFAHGEVFMAGALSGYFVFEAWNNIAPNSESLWAPFLVSLFVGGIVGGLLAWLIQRVLYQPLISRGRLALILAALAASLFLQQVALLIMRTHNTGASEVRIQADLLQQNHMGMTPPELMGGVVLVASFFVVLWILFRTDFGLKMRVVSYSTNAMKRLRIPLKPVLSRAFLLGGFLGGIAGVVYGAQYSVTPYMGFVPGLKAFLACIVGGPHLLAAVAGGFFIGTLEGLASGYVGAGLREIIVGITLILLLILRPDGIITGRRPRTL